MCQDMAFKYEYQVLHLKQMFSGERFQRPWPLVIVQMFVQEL